MRVPTGISMNSWGDYHARFKGGLLIFHRLNIYLIDSEDAERELLSLGYSQSTFSKTHGEFESHLACGQYAFTTTFDDHDEAEVEVIEIQHAPIRSLVQMGSTGLSFMANNTDQEMKLFVSGNFGISTCLVHSVCMFEGYSFKQENLDGFHIEPEE